MIMLQGLIDFVSFPPCSSVSLSALSFCFCFFFQPTVDLVEFKSQSSVQHLDSLLLPFRFLVVTFPRIFPCSRATQELSCGFLNAHGTFVFVVLLCNLSLSFLSCSCIIDKIHP